tara:strand:- start:6732 stop:7742 length:1011 start_codon:yes stop_codon:yes gene_type:complete
MISKKKIFIVAEVGNNHEGNFALAKKLIKKAKDCGADAVKFQTFIPDLYVSIKDKKRYNQLKKFQLSYKNFKALSKYAKKINIKFFSTPFDLKSAVFLNKIQNFFKISSGDNNFLPLIKKIANFNKPIFLSTGLSDLVTIEKTKKRIFQIWKKNKNKNKKLFILHCVSSYPTTKEEANLLAIKTLQRKFKDCTIGYSDHTLDISAALASVSLGAKVIERHFTIDNKFSNFRDHRISSDPSEFKKLVNSIRKLEKTLGTGEKILQKSEKKIINFVRRSAVATQDLPKGHKVKKDDLKWVRATNGLKINFEKKIIGNILIKQIKKNDTFKKSFFKNIN